MPDWMPARKVLEHPLWGNTVGEWLVALVVFVGVVAGLALTRRFVTGRLARWAGRSTSRADDIIVAVLGSTKWFFYFAVGAYTASASLDVPESAETVLSTATVIVFLVQLGVWFQTAVRTSVEAWQARQEGPGSTTAGAAVSFVSRLIIWTLVALLVMANLGIEINALIAGLGVGGVAAALAVQSVLGDLFASLSIYFDRPFDIGDFIIVDDMMGTVDKIGLRTTRLRALGGEQLIFSNSDLTRSRIRNYRRMQERRIAFSIGIEYNLPSKKVEAVPGILREAVEATDSCRFDRAHFKEYGTSSLNFETVYYVLSPDYNVYMDVQQAINFHILKRFEAEGIPFAFPTRTLHVRQDGGWDVSRPERPADSERRLRDS